MLILWQVLLFIICACLQSILLNGKLECDWVFASRDLMAVTYSFALYYLYTQAMRESRKHVQGNYRLYT